MSLDTLKTLLKTKSGTLAREVVLIKCLEDGKLINRMEHYGDNQDILSDDNINAELEANNPKYKKLIRSRFCR